MAYRFKNVLMRNKKKTTHKIDKTSRTCAAIKQKYRCSTNGLVRWCKSPIETFSTFPNPPPPPWKLVFSHLSTTKLVLTIRLGLDLKLLEGNITTIPIYPHYNSSNGARMYHRFPRLPRRFCNKEKLYYNMTKLNLLFLYWLICTYGIIGMPSWVFSLNTTRMLLNFTHIWYY